MTYSISKAGEPISLLKRLPVGGSSVGINLRLLAARLGRLVAFSLKSSILKLLLAFFGVEMEDTFL